MKHTVKPVVTVEPLITVTGLSKRYGEHVVLDQLDFSLPLGIHALLGPNGAGKTTLVNILSTLLPADSGTARVLGHDLPAGRAALRREISVTGQFAAVDDVLTGTENLVMMGRLLGLPPVPARTRAAELAGRFGLTKAAERRVSTYSGGMRRKLDLAVSLLGSPRLIFLDEPTTGLDTTSRRAMWDLIGELAEDGTSVFLTTQYLEEADAMADRVLVLDQGRIVAEGPPARLKAQAGATRVEIHDEHGRVSRTLPSDGTVADLARALAGVAQDSPHAEISVRRPSLDEAFLALTGGDRR